MHGDHVWHHCQPRHRLKVAHRVVGQFGRQVGVDRVLAVTQVRAVMVEIMDLVADHHFLPLEVAVAVAGAVAPESVEPTLIGVGLVVEGQEFLDKEAMAQQG